MNMPVLEDGLVRAEFDQRTGALVGLEHKETGWKVIGRGELGISFRMLVPLPDRRNNPVEGNLQAPPEVRLGGDGRSLELDWEKLKSRHGGAHDISFHAGISLEGGRLTFDGRIVNRSKLTVENAAFPCLGEISMPPGEEQVDCVPAGGYLNRFPLMPRFSGRGDYFGHDHPTAMVAYPETAFVIAAGRELGLYAGCHDTGAGEMVQFTFEVKPGLERLASIGNGFFTPGADADGKPSRLEFSAWHLPFVGPGGEAGLLPVVVAPYAGCWYRGADIYKEWRRSWFRRPPAPDWSLDIHSWQQIQMNSPEDELRFGFRDLPSIGRDCARHGVKAIQLVGWNSGGQDRNNPSHDPDPRLGTAAELKGAIREIQAMGVKMVLFTKFTWADRSTERYRQELHRCAVRDPYGDEYVYGGYQYQTITQMSDINTRRLIPMCMLDPAWRSAAAAEFVKCLDLGADGMLYDEAQHHGPGRYCFSPDHGHPVPSHVYMGDSLLAEEFRRISAAKAPGFLFAGEACYDLEWRHYSIAYTRLVIPGHMPVQRYIDPFGGVMVAVTGFDDRDTVNEALLNRYVMSYEPYNFKGRLEDFPRTLEYGKKMDAFRRRYRRFLWDGEFRGTLGARVTMNGKPTEHYSVFRDAEGNHAVAVANYDAQSRKDAVIEVDWGKRKPVMATPDAPDPQPFGGIVVLYPGSAAVIMAE